MRFSEICEEIERSEITGEPFPVPAAQGTGPVKKSAPKKIVSYGINDMDRAPLTDGVRDPELLTALRADHEAILAGERGGSFDGLSVDQIAAILRS